ncbi:MAG: MinD/ParA family protein [Brevinematia bacterium]
MIIEEQLKGLQRALGETAILEKPKIVSVASGKGGVGKTNIAINLGILFSKMGKRVLVLDGDLGLGNVNVVLGIIPKYNLYHVMKGGMSLRDVIVKCEEVGIDIIATGSGFTQLAELEEIERKRFIEELKNFSEYDILIIDTAAGIGRNVISFVLASHEAVIVTTPEPTAITDAYGIIKAISTESLKLSSNVKLVVNRVKNPSEGIKISDRIATVAGQFLGVKIESLGFIPEDPSVEFAVRRQQPFVLAFPSSQATLHLKHVAQRLENMKVKEEDRGLNRLFKALFGG